MSGPIHRVALIVVVLGFAALVGLAVVPGARMKLRDAAFRDVGRGDTRERAIELMGPPASRTEPARDDLHRYWDEEVNPACAAEDVKTVLTWRLRAFFLPVTWQVGFNNDARAVAKHRYE